MVFNFKSEWNTSSEQWPWTCCSMPYLCCKMRALSLVNWARNTSVIGWQKSNKFMSLPVCWSILLSANHRCILCPVDQWECLHFVAHILIAFLSSIHTKIIVISPYAEQKIIFQSQVWAPCNYYPTFLLILSSNFRGQKLEC